MNIKTAGQTHLRNIQLKNRCAPVHQGRVSVRGRNLTDIFLLQTCGRNTCSILIMPRIWGLTLFQRTIYSSEDGHIVIRDEIQDRRPVTLKEVKGAGHGFDGKDSDMAREVSIDFIKIYEGIAEML